MEARLSIYQVCLFLIQNVSLLKLNGNSFGYSYLYLFIYYSKILRDQGFFFHYFFFFLEIIKVIKILIDFSISSWEGGVTRKNSIYTRKTTTISSL